METVAETLVRVMDGTDHAERIALALVERAEAGDLKAVQLVLAMLGEDPENKAEEDAVYRIELGPGVERLCK